MITLLVGFDSAWTPSKSGALVGVLRFEDGTFRELGSPRIANYAEAESMICEWQADHLPKATIILLDQPTIVKNAEGQRPVENIVGSPVGRRYGGIQPAHTGKKEMFGEGAPVWKFLGRFGGPANPLEPAADTRVFETYPVLTLIALGWILPDRRPVGRLPKYNPDRNTFSISDWKHVCTLASGAFSERGLVEIKGWIEDAAQKASPRKEDQDTVDACLCLLVALYLAEQKDCLMVGNMQTGYIVVPYSTELHAELDARCTDTGRVSSDWVRKLRLQQGRGNTLRLSHVSPELQRGKRLRIPPPSLLRAPGAKAHPFPFQVGLQTLEFLNGTLFHLIFADIAAGEFVRTPGAIQRIKMLFLESGCDKQAYEDGWAALQKYSEIFKKSPYSNVLILLCSHWDWYIRQIGMFLQFGREHAVRAALLVDENRLKRIDRLPFSEQLDLLGKAADCVFAADTLAEMNLVRNLGLHNHWEVDETYIRHSKTEGLLPGDLRLVDLPELQSWHSGLIEIVSKSSTAIAQRYADAPDFPDKHG